MELKVKVAMSGLEPKSKILTVRHIPDDLSGYDLSAWLLDNVYKEWVLDNVVGTMETIKEES